MADDYNFALNQIYVNWLRKIENIPNSGSSINKGMVARGSKMY